MTINPQIASEWLASSLGNRPLSKRTVDSYAEDMSNGKWILNGESITLDEEEHLVNGHHRLTAVVKSGVAIQSNVVFGVDYKSSYTTTDKGRRRNIGQDLCGAGFSYYKTVSAGLLGYLHIKYGYKTTNYRLKNIGITPSVFFDIACENKEDLERVAKFSATYTAKMKQVGRLIDESTICSTCFYLTKELNVSFDKIKFFYDELISLDSSTNPHIDLLRKSLLRNVSSKTKLSNNCVYNMLVKTWNKYVSKSENASKQIKWQEYGDTPEPWQTFKAE